MNEKWLGARITAPAARHVVGGDRARAQARVRVQRGDEACQLVAPVRFARARALVEAVEVLLRPRVAIHLLAHRRQLAHLLSMLPRRISSGGGCGSLHRSLTALPRGGVEVTPRERCVRRPRTASASDSCGDLFADVGGQQRVVKLPLCRMRRTVDDARTLQVSQRAADGL